MFGPFVSLGCSIWALTTGVETSQAKGALALSIACMALVAYVTWFAG